MKKSDGFSLIELSVVLVVIGLLTVPLITFVNLYMKEHARRITQENLDTISRAMGAYFDTFGHYPCPARLNAKETDLDYGDETGCSYRPVSNVSVQTVSTDFGDQGCPDGVCTASGLNSDKIKIGAVPYKALGIVRETILDGYDNKITYAVTERYATPLRGLHLGAISINNAKGEPAVLPEGSAQFVLLSHGADGKGSYTSSGDLNGTGCADQEGVDNENCDFDNVFIDGEYSEAEGYHYFDDELKFKMTGNSLLWQTSPFDQRNIYNATLGNVGIGTRAPVAKLHVGGDARITGRLHTTGLCDQAGNDCFEPGLIGGDGMHCTKKNEAMIGVEDAKPVCEKIKIINLGSEKCPTSYFAVGFTLEGKLLCMLPDWVETPENTENVTLD